jgi:hypothetical protein
MFMCHTKLILGVRDPPSHAGSLTVCRDNLTQATWKNERSISYDHGCWCWWQRIKRTQDELSRVACYVISLARAGQQCVNQWKKGQRNMWWLRVLRRCQSLTLCSVDDRMSCEWWIGKYSEGDGRCQSLTLCSMDDRMSCEWWIGKYSEGDGRCLMEVLTLRKSGGTKGNQETR